MSDQPKQGGTEWELSEAIRLMGDAVASGDPAHIATAMRRHGEALSNSAAMVLIPTLKTTLESVLKTQIGAVTRRLDNSDKARLNRNAELQDHIDNRFDSFGGELQGLRADVQHAAAETAARLVKSEQDIEELTARLNALDPTARETLREHKRRLEALEDWRIEMQAMRDALAELSRRIGGALPTEADQELSSQLRVEEAGRVEHG